MRILVKYIDDRMEYMYPKQLELFLALNLVKEFERSTGWVKVGIDPIRKRGNPLPPSRR
jgi:hypothetical protein